jgi:hypothetical protein
VVALSDDVRPWLRHPVFRALGAERCHTLARAHVFWRREGLLVQQGGLSVIGDRRILEAMAGRTADADRRPGDGRACGTLFPEEAAEKG